MKKYLIYVLSLFVILSSCKDDDDPKPIGKIANIKIEKNTQNLLLTWDAFKNTKTYKVVVNDTESEILAKNKFVLQNLKTENTIIVKAFSNSDASKKIAEGQISYHYEKPSLGKIKNIRVEKVNDKLIVKWDAFDNAKTYKAIVNNVASEITKKTELALTNLKSENKINIEAFKDDKATKKIAEGQISYQHKEKYGKINNIRVEGNDPCVVIWDKYEKAFSYNIIYNNDTSVTVDTKKVLEIYEEYNAIKIEAFKDDKRKEKIAEGEIKYHNTVAKLQNIRVENIYNQFFLLWDNIENANYYTVAVGGMPVKVNKPKFELTQFMQTKYKAIIRAYDETGLLIAKSKYEFLCPEPVYASIKNIKVAKKDDAYTLKWDAIEATANYKILVNSVEFTSTTNQKQITFTQPENRILVEAYHNNGKKIAEGQIDYTAIFIKTIENIIVKKQNEKFVINWDALAGSDKYNVIINNVLASSVTEPNHTVNTLNENDIIKIEAYKGDDKIGIGQIKYAINSNNIEGTSWECRHTSEMTGKEEVYTLRFKENMKVLINYGDGDIEYTYTFNENTQKGEIDPGGMVSGDFEINNNWTVLTYRNNEYKKID
ncbi:MAG: hypothetical protein MI739_12635 [Bacteroidales bacterium]|nr:hypothetical protein [Bacteroidales bacterium]